MRINNVLASLAAVGLLAAQPLAAAEPVRTGAVTEEAEEFAGLGGGGAMIAVVAVLAVAVAALWPVVFDDDDNRPVSP